MQARFFGQQLLFRFYMVGVGHATVNRADCRTLRLFVKAHAFGALIGYDVVVIVGYGSLFSRSVYDAPVFQDIGATHRSTVGYSPFYSAS
jgi:hypothetical protein